MARVFLGVLVALGVGSIVISLSGLVTSTLGTTALLVLLYALAWKVPVVVAPGGGATLATAVGIAALMGGTANGIIVAALGGALALLLEKRRIGLQALLEATVATLAVASAGFTYTLLGGKVPVAADLVHALPAAAATGAYAATALGLYGLGRLLGFHQGVSAIWPAAVSYLCLGLIGVCAAHALAAAPVPMAAGLVSAVGVAWLAARTREVQQRSEREQASEVRARIGMGAVAWPSARGLLPKFAQVADALDRYNQHHGERAMLLASETARRLGLSERTVAVAEMAALLHDIGKMHLPSQVLNKQGALTADERDLMERHPTMSAELVHSVVELAEDLIQAVQHHHERFDGRGYPSRLTAEEVPITAKIAGVVEAYQAMISDRPYRRALEHQAALDELRRESGSKFDPTVVEAFIAACEPAAVERLSEELAPVNAEAQLALIEA